MNKKIWKAIIFLLVTVPLFLAGCGSKNGTGEYVVRINGEAVSKNEFMLYLLEAQRYFDALGGKEIWEMDFDGKTAEETAKDRALDSLIMVKVTAQKAKELNITLNESDKEAVKESVHNQYETMTEAEKLGVGLTEEEMFQCMEEQSLFNRVFEAIVENYVISEADFSSYYDTHAEELKNRYTRLTVKRIMIRDKAAADSALQRIKAGEDFVSVAIEVSELPVLQENKGESVEVFKDEVEAKFGVSFDLKEGEISNVLEAADGYYIVKLEKIQPSPEEDVVNYAKGAYTSNMQQQLFNQEYIKWRENAVIDKNEEIWKEIKIIQE